MPEELPPSLPAPTGPPPPASRVVETDDGVLLHVEVDEPGADGGTTASLTVVFSHGFTARLAEWELQRAALRGRARLVLWDQRGHGRSAATPCRTRRSTAPAATSGRCSTPSSPLGRCCWSATPWAG
ncbi:hypothetical protein [Blastococcus brunescens]|uniref:Serine aminopeptidase S33 domain-containing protein n=1 Tax=Blastococcus brunescens TaxID=1564165 RepID=A0ABZ1B8U0_9ACTN|nr:hypothetical protein [Blastococcus sp. BMG 8361]WRL65794.1 hypothetical protein U6N30_09625 [Blastococcus sp. BMG 8361]